MAALVVALQSLGPVSSRASCTLFLGHEAPSGHVHSGRQPSRGGSAGWRAAATARQALAEQPHGRGERVRACTDKSEAGLLMRALRDLDLAKLVEEDMVVSIGPIEGRLPAELRTMPRAQDGRL